MSRAFIRRIAFAHDAQTVRILRALLESGDDEIRAHSVEDGDSGDWFADRKTGELLCCVGAASDVGNGRVREIFESLTVVMPAREVWRRFGEQRNRRVDVF